MMGMSSVAAARGWTRVSGWSSGERDVVAPSGSAGRKSPREPHSRQQKTPAERGFLRERLKGLEPSTFCMASRRSSQLSYSREVAEYNPPSGGRGSAGNAAATGLGAWASREVRRVKAPIQDEQGSVRWLALSRGLRAAGRPPGGARHAGPHRPGGHGPRRAHRARVSRTRRRCRARRPVRPSRPAGRATACAGRAGTPRPTHRQAKPRGRRSPPA